MNNKSFSRNWIITHSVTAVCAYKHSAIMICHCFWGSIVIVLSNICLSSVSYPFTIFLGGGFISRDRRVSHDSATHHTHVTVSRVETEHISFGDYHGGANCYNLSNIYFVLTQLICCLCYNLIRGYSNFNAVEIPISGLRLFAPSSVKK